MNKVDVIVIGGGAAGLMCAITAGQRGRSVMVLEGSNRIGKKILMSGGGRCNFTNVHTEASCFISENPHFCKSALSRYTPADFIALVEKHEIAYHEKTLGQLFCDKTSKDIVAMLLKECDNAGVIILTDSVEITVKHEEEYVIDCNHGRFCCQSLVIATGGLSIPKMGATDFGYRIARQFDIDTLDTRAGLVPFTFTGEMLELCNRLSGISCKVSVTAGETSFTEDLLFTHRGLSGPSILQASSYWSPGESISIDLLPGVDAKAMLLEAKTARPRSLLRVVLAESLPKALVAELQEIFWRDSSKTPLSDIRDESLRRIGSVLNNWALKPAATEGYRTAEVTLGGISTKHLSSKTMECTHQPGLYFIGEVVDVTGHLGGYNFQWAWSSGYAAGLAA
ncbi:MAG: NAD(P)/FAD-dependent oxidoreductase [Gammaproteobacteria bacterium]|nr:NAD(P)/FAD-dependent oxidoreductase [Gammaproteobacteria bacterium]